MRGICIAFVCQKEKTIMIEKYIIEVNSKRIAFKYHFQTNRMIIGGYFRDREYIENLIVGYMHDYIPNIQFPQRNKIKYSFVLGKRIFDNILKELEDNNFIFVKVNSHGRLMR
jgi:hypothetical protein